MEDIKISVAVTTYKRPKMVEDLIKSYLAQSYQSSELVIVDDCVEDTETEALVVRYARIDPRIRLIKNKSNLGYCKNFLKSLTESKGEYVVTLGDDDILLDSHALEKYVDVFESNPKVGFIYSSILQFNQDYQMDYVYKNFHQDTLFQTLEESLRGIWLRSCYIPGIGLRNNVDFQALYPEKDWLFPQVELIGKILGTAQAYGIADFLIGGRAHTDQLGFAAVNKKRIKKNERHSSLELIEIFERLVQFYAGIGISLGITNDFVKDFFIESHASILPTEKINTGNIRLLQVFFQAIRKNKNILCNGRYLFYMLISLLLPGKALLYLKNKYKQHLVETTWSNERNYFSRVIKEIGIVRG